MALLNDPKLDPQQEALRFIVSKPATATEEAIQVPDVKTALEGARDILAERFAETASLLALIRHRFEEQGWIHSAVVPGKEMMEEEKFRDYYDYTEKLKTVPSHRALALFRGRSLGVLSVTLGLGAELEALTPHPCESMIASHVGIENQGRPADPWLLDVCRWSWRVKILLVADREPLHRFGRFCYWKRDWDQAGQSGHRSRFLGRLQ